MPHAPSYYAASALPQPQRPALQGTHRTDVCIVGAGYTGVSAALHLAEAGYKVHVLEAEQVGWGASGRNGGQIVHSFSRDMDTIESTYGPDVAKPLGAMIFEGAKIIRERVSRYGIQCDLKSGGIYAAYNARKTKQLQEHQSLWQRWGHPGMQLIVGDEIKHHVQSDLYHAILIDPTGGHIHPLNLALGQATALESLGGVISEHSPVMRVERPDSEGGKSRVHTSAGTVEANFVILAGNAYLGQLEPALAAKSMPCGTQVIATEPLGERWKQVLPTDHCVEDNNFLLDYYRLSGDKRLIFGGGVIYGARDPARIEQRVRPSLEKTFPQLRGVKIDYAWTGNFLLTLSRLPQVGRLHPGIYYSQGCSGHGVTFTHLIGRVLAEAIRGQAERFDAFARLPHYPFPGGRLLRVPLTALGAVWYDLRDRLGL
ncbi:NAD(P)/FAD-dependent oxidoreductase [Pseudomarimonas arenosa]|uniref:FAD-binding oxidoreductase n=1 Tax=Pseudomarimonas arenosa TaxID=2774145 RepID=A0AAW3ZNP4_9GAMM|nr:FAD-binding oxidoreductase [Pseudomarimonas arenosa]MBD8527760.1 FAD-binding oxidoreductase [Pseudomarimonas arenosa]